MQWRHMFKQVDVSDALKMYVEGEFFKISRHLLKESQWQIFYSKGKHNQHSVDVTVHNGNGHFKASGQGETFYLAVDEAADKLEKQFQKKKEKLQEHKDFNRSREAKLDRVNPRLEYDNAPFPLKKQA